MFSTKAQIYTFTRQVYRRLKNESFMVKFMRQKGVAGKCYPGINWIELNPSEDVLSTLVHEMLHDIYPDWTEKKVLKMENLLMNKLSHKQMINLWVALGESLKRNYPIWERIK